MNTTKHVTVPVTLYFLACGNDKNGNGKCNYSIFLNTVTYSKVRYGTIRSRWWDKSGRNTVQYKEHSIKFPVSNNSSYGASTSNKKIITYLSIIP